jgi:hypothetical protein
VRESLPHCAATGTCFVAKDLVWRCHAIIRLCLCAGLCWQGSPRRLWEQMKHRGVALRGQRSERLRIDNKSLDL